MPKLPHKVIVFTLLGLLSYTTFAGEMNCPPNEYLQASGGLLIFKEKNQISDTLYEYSYQAGDAFKWNNMNWALFVDSAANNDTDALLLAKRKLATNEWAHIWSTMNVCRYYGQFGMIEARSYARAVELK